MEVEYSRVETKMFARWSTLIEGMVCGHVMPSVHGSRHASIVGGVFLVVPSEPCGTLVLTCTHACCVYVLSI